jgi:hypothetical protein
MERRFIQLLFSALLATALIAAAAGAEGPQPGAAVRGPAPKPASKKAAPNKPVPDSTAQKNVDVCKLLTAADIQSVQGDRVEEVKPSTQTSSGLLISQCLFRTAMPAKSVSLALAASSRQKPRDFWRKQFHSETDKQDPEAKETTSTTKHAPEPDKEEGSQARPIPGLGDEAYWVGGPITGALYVLRGGSFIRVSVGGERQEFARIEKSITLARAALKRM